MRRIVACLVAYVAFGCAGTSVLPAVSAGAPSDPAAHAEAKRDLPSEPRPQWRVAPNEHGAGIELRF